MALTGQNIIDRSSMIIQDITNVRWPLTELTNWLNDGRRELAISRPEIYTAYETVTLAADAKQTLSALTNASASGKGLKLRDVPRNTTSGRAISLTQRGFLDQQNPTWQTSVGAATNGGIKHFMLDERSPDVFWVYPKPADSSCQVDLIYQYTPKDYTSGTPASGEQALTVELAAYETLYGGALVDYLCYRAFSKDSEYAGNAQRALAHYQQFQNALALGHKNDLTYSPNLTNVGGVPSKQMAVGG